VIIYFYNVQKIVSIEPMEVLTPNAPLATPLIVCGDS